jgi:hypothetical protein
VRAGVVLLFTCLACSTGVKPPVGDPRRAALYRDLERIVTVRQTTGWQIDRLETDASLGDALMSACRVDGATRRDLVAWLDSEIDRLGGPARRVFQETGKLRGDLVSLDRIRALAAAADEAADRDCPFWVVPERRFRGRQLLDDRFLLVAEGGGKVIGIRQAGRNDLAGGGAARLLFGRGVGQTTVFLVGVEAGGTASFPRDAMGERGDLTLGLDLAFPAAIRLVRVNTYLELEAGPLIRFVEDRDSEAGVHVGLAVGVRSLRTRWFTPGIALAATYEQTFGDDLVRLLKLGLRVTVDIGL